MTPNGRRAWRAAAKKLRRKMGQRWRSQKEWLFGKRWSELVPDLEAHRGHITGAWFKRHGFTEQCLQKLDSPHPVRVYVGLWGTADGDGVEYAVKPKPFTAHSLVGMTMGARKRAARVCPGCIDFRHELPDVDYGVRCDSSGIFERATTPLCAKYRIGERLRPCPGCCACWGCEQDPTRINPLSGNTLHWAGPVRKHTFEFPMGPPFAGKSKQQIARMRKWQDILPNDCDGSGVLQARRGKR